MDWVRGSWWPLLRSGAGHAFAADATKGAAALGAQLVLTALWGVAFWWTGTRLFSPSQVGAQWAAVSVATLLGVFSPLGTGAALIRYLPEASPAEKAGLLRGAIGVTLMTAALTGVGAIVGLPFLAEAMNSLRSPLGAVPFLIDVAASGLLVLGDETALALGQPRLIAEKTLLLGACRLAVVVPFAHVHGSGLLWADAMGTAAAALYGWMRLTSSGRLRSGLSSPQTHVHIRFSLGAWLVGVLATVPVHTMPLLLTWRLGAETAGMVAPAWLALTYFRAVPNALATAVYAAAARNQGAQHTWRPVLWAGLAVATLVGIMGPLAGYGAFHLLASQYRRGVALLWWAPLLLPLSYAFALQAVQARLERRPWVIIPSVGAGSALTLVISPFLLSFTGAHGAPASWALGIAMSALLSWAILSPPRHGLTHPQMGGHRHAGRRSAPLEQRSDRQQLLDERPRWLSHGG